MSEQAANATASEAAVFSEENKEKTPPVMARSLSATALEESENDVIDAGTGADADDEDDDSDEDEKNDEEMIKLEEMIETTSSSIPVSQLGFLEKPIRATDLLRGQFPSKVGGKPAWLNPKDLPTVERLMCDGCNKPLSFLLQVYAPNNLFEQTFHRSLYIFVCLSDVCKYTPSSIISNSSNISSDNNLNSKNSSVDFRLYRCFRTNLPKKNEFYPSSPSESDDEGDDDDGEGDEEQDDNVPLVDDAPWPTAVAPLCTLCGFPAPKQCGQCKQVHYCSRDHQVLDWKCAHKQECAELQQGNLQQKAPTTSDSSNGSSLRSSSSASTSASSVSMDPTSRAHQRGVARRRCLLLQRELVTEREVFLQEKGTAKISNKNPNNGGDGNTDGETPLHLQVDSATEKALVEAYEQKQRAMTAEDKAADDKEYTGGWGKMSRLNKEDPLFGLFQQRVKHNPEQVLRYVTVKDRKAGYQPLWFSSHNKLEEQAVPPCGVCGGERGYELQIMPQLLYLLGPQFTQEHPNVDFGTLVVYSCKNSCCKATSGGDTEGETEKSISSPSSYVEEFMFVQSGFGAGPTPDMKSQLEAALQRKETTGKSREGDVSK